MKKENIKKDPSKMSPEEFQQEIKNAVKGAASVWEAKIRIKKLFSPEIKVLAGIYNNTNFNILTQQHPNEKAIHLICER